MKPLVLLLGLCWAVAVQAADWPDKIFAPYMYVGAGDHFRLTDCDDACGQKFYTLAFIIADKQGDPAWDGRFSPETNFYADQINAIRDRGGDVIVSFGGADGTEIAIVETNATVLEAKYQSLIDRYHFTWLDFDIEGDSLKKTGANHRRNSALAELQRKNPGLRITFTLPVDPKGISQESREMLADARAQGVAIYSANVMTMDYGEDFSKGETMSAVSIASVRKAHQQCRKIDPALRIGITAMIGQNDVQSEVLTQTDATTLVEWAKTKRWVGSVSFWASNRDAGQADKMKNGNLTSGVAQKPWEFSRIFQTFRPSAKPTNTP